MGMAELPMALGGAQVALGAAAACVVDQCCGQLSSCPVRQSEINTGWGHFAT